MTVESHPRKADADTLAILKEEHAKGPFPAVLHCFTGGRDLAMGAVDLGLYVSFSGVISFKKSEALREIAREVPLDRILIETDAPFLAPEPYRGKLNEPAYIVHTAKALAESRARAAGLVDAGEIRMAVLRHLYGDELSPATYSAVRARLAAADGRQASDDVAVTGTSTRS